MRAGIKVWMITGDKVETAINIGLSCKLVTQETKLLTLRNKSVSSNNNNEEEPIEKINEYYFNELLKFKNEIQNEKLRCKFENKNFNVGVVFESEALKNVMKYQNIVQHVI